MLVGVPWGSVVSCLRVTWVKCAHTPAPTTASQASHPIPVSDPGSTLLPLLALLTELAHPPGLPRPPGYSWWRVGAEVSFPHSAGKDTSRLQRGWKTGPGPRGALAGFCPSSLREGPHSRGSHPPEQVGVWSPWTCPASEIDGGGGGHRHPDQGARLPAGLAALRLYGLGKPPPALGLSFLPRKGGIFILTRLVLRDALRSSVN